MNNRKKEKLQTDEDSMCSFESRWKHKKEMQTETVVSVFFASKVYILVDTKVRICYDELV